MKTFVLILSLTLLFSVVYSSSLNRPMIEFLNNRASIKDRFKLFHRLFEKPYNLNSQLALERYKVFKNNLDIIEEHNSKNLSYKLGITPFADLTMEEFVEKYSNKLMTKLKDEDIKNNDYNEYDDTRHDKKKDNNNNNNNERDDRDKKNSSINFDLMADEYDKEDSYSRRILKAKFVERNGYTKYNINKTFLKEENGKNYSCECKCKRTGDDDNNNNDDDNNNNNDDDNNNNDDDNNNNNDDNNNDDDNKPFVSKDHSNLWPYVKDQGTCGSCWTFSTTAVVEAMYKLKHKKYLELSEQYLVDCSLKNEGCNGGNHLRSFRFLLEQEVPTAEDYPYKMIRAEPDEIRNECKTGLGKVKVTGLELCDDYLFSYSDKKCSTEKIKKIIQNGPYASGIDPYVAENHLYSSGILPSDKCYRNEHAITVVKIDYKDNYIKYRNSYGPNWGENGYGRHEIKDSDINLGYTIKGCFMLNEAYQVNL